jgi:Domain of unknown function (DUF4129)
VTRPLKAGALALGIVGLLVLVAMAARGSHPGTDGHVATRAVPNSVQDTVITLLALAYGLGIVAIVVLFFQKRPWHEPDDSRWLRNFATVMVLAAVVIAVATFAVKHRNDAKGQRVDAIPGQPTTTNRQGRLRSVPAREAHFQWPLAVGVAGLILLGGVWLYVSQRRELTPRGRDGSLEADIVSAIETTIDDLRSERDARKAVIAAYALMERTLSAHGLARDRAEAPMEYLGRILHDLNVRDSAVRTITELFEYAKFSRHEIDTVMKEQAIDALLAVRDDLQRGEELAA